ncbi:MAG: aldehyde ferredoxin oxidoreductase family protein [Bacillota bacterium]
MPLEGYHNKVLHVDLTSGHSEVLPVSEERLAGYVGGIGLSTRFVTEIVPAGADPFSPENALAFFSGPLSGTTAPAFAQTVLVTKSPLTGGVINAYSGGNLAAALKGTGYDGVLVTGRAPRLCYLVVTPAGAQVTEAPEMAGRHALDAEDYIRSRVGGKRVGVAAIGLAGENRVRFAAVMSQTRAFGRGGAGAVMGSKNLKAVAFSGDVSTRLWDPNGFRRAVEEARASLAEATSNEWSLLGMFSRYGTGSGMALVNEKHALATENHRKATFEGALAIDAHAYLSLFPSRRYACWACPIHCGQVRAVDASVFGRPSLRGPEYETMYSLGSNLALADPQALALANQLAEDYGMDTISAGGVIGFAMECAEKGILAKGALGEEPLRFGNGATVTLALHRIARREGVGDLLAEGVKRASAHLGQGSGVFAMHVKGMEFAAWMPARMRGIALAFATSNRGACHKRAPVGAEIMGFMPMESTQGKAAVVKEIQDKVNAVFTLISCRFAEFQLKMDHYLALLKAATGLDMSEEGLLTLGERIWNLERVYNRAGGWTRQDDWLPDRCFEPVVGPDIGSPLTREELAAMIEEYYHLRGWDEQGVPLPETLGALDL